MSLIRKVYYALRAVTQHPLSRGQPWWAVRKFCQAQLAARLVPGDICVPFPNDLRLLIPPRMKGTSHFISPGLCEFDDMVFVMHFLRPADLFADVGANIGAFTVLAAGVAGAQTVSFEPGQSAYRYLEHNVRLNDFVGKSRLLNVAVGRQSGRLRMTQGLGTENHVSMVAGESSADEVEVTTLDAAFTRRAPSLIKIDVEGFETEAMAGAQMILSDLMLEAMIIERSGNSTRYGFDETLLHASIRSRGFIPCAYSGLERRLFEIAPDATGNIIYLRDLKTARQRLETAPPFRFAGREI